MKPSFRLSFILASTIAAGVASAQDVHPVDTNIATHKKEYSPYIDDNFPNRALFVDTHLHITWPETSCHFEDSACMIDSDKGLAY